MAVGTLVAKARRINTADCLSTLARAENGIDSRRVNFATGSGTLAAATSDVDAVNGVASMARTNTHVAATGGGVNTTGSDGSTGTVHRSGVARINAGSSAAPTATLRPSILSAPSTASAALHTLGVRKADIRKAHIEVVAGNITARAHLPAHRPASHLSRDR